MGKDVIELARQRLTAAQEEVDRCREFLQMAGEFLGTDVVPEGLGGASVRQNSIAARAAAALKKMGPMHLKRLAAVLGLGEKGESSLNSSLWRRKDLFERDEEGCYRLKAEDYVLAGTNSQVGKKEGDGDTGSAVGGQEVSDGTGEEEQQPGGPGE